MLTARFCCSLRRRVPLPSSTLVAIRNVPLHATFSASAHCRSLSAHPPPASVEPLTIGIIGSGPAGFYTAQHLLKNLSHAKIDMYESLPIPYGLARFGVSPDHPEVKNVIHKFASIAEDSRFRFVGNVTVGRDVPFSKLASCYDAVVLSYGAAEDRKLGLPNEESTKNVFAARAFVGWYNGIPEYAGLEPDLTSSDTAVIAGQGNVALDVARTLLTPPDVLAKTDITEHALEALRKSKIRHVHLLGRRGPLQIAFTAKELREMIALPDTKLDVDINVVKEQVSADAEALATDRQRRRLMELLVQGATKKFDSPTARTWSLKFMRSPAGLVQSQNGSLAAVQLEKNRLEGSLQNPKAVGTGEVEELPAGLLIRSIGYKSVRLFDEVPFDPKRSLIPNVKGRVVDGDAPVPGLYVSGWLKRGPSGVIAATMYCAIETATAIVEGLQAGHFATRVASRGPGGFDALEPLLKAKGVDPVSFSDWKHIDRVETELGAKRGKPREKLVDVKAMMDVVAAGRANR
ncbi:hypothetical protein HDU87_008363 [Geranomyces variabilis]|uniref:NADPH:adrenodoxin oxidoreductase, mitochondrial n=1 Tax=Geranomyces variabilis TaxID=109894 RepID=A0AAD5XJT7_9FUNG|nr:hypothetical protein HDU87_008363 [Geranomyces variabilis]